MNKFTRLMAIMLVAVMAVSCFAFNASAAEKTVTVKVGDVEVAYDEAKLALLADGNTASGATAFSDAGLVGFENKGFTHTDGVDAAVEATFEIVLDLGEAQNITSISLDAYKESNSMIALPTVDYYVSADGENYYQINAGAAVNPAADAAENAVATLKADFSTRIAVKAQYVKAVVTFKNGWVFLSELSVTTNAEAAFVDELGMAYPYSEHLVPNPGIGVYDITDGELDLSVNEGDKLFKNSQIIKAVYDEAADAYKIEYSNVNPWPDGNSGTITLAEGEILVFIATGGTVASDEFSGSKWLARGLGAGDWIVLEEGTIKMLTAGEIVPEQPEDPSEPEQPSEPEVDEKALYEEEYAGLVGEALENPSYNLALDSTTDENGVVTVTVTVTDIAEGVELTGLYAYLYYDMDRMTLTTKVNTDNSLDCLTTVPSESWREDNLTVIDKDEGFINIGAGVADGDIVAISEDKPLVLTFTFQLKEGYEYAGIYMPTENVSGTDFDFADYYGNGAYEIAELPVVDDEPSDEPSKPVTPGGDAGVIVFAVLGLIAICGAAVVVKVRH